MSWNEAGCNCPEIHFAKEQTRGAYDGPSHHSSEVISVLPDGHQLSRSFDGTIVSRRVIGNDKLGATVCDAHGRRVIVRHVGETDQQLITRWKRGVELGWF